MNGLFITGTNTEVGKTYVGALIARQLVASGVRLGVYKPVASGCRREGDQLLADDAIQLWEAAGRPGSLDRVCPQRYFAPLAPPQAANAEGKRVDSDLLRSGLQFWRDKYNFVLVEGAGGLLSPLSDSDFNADVAKDLGLPLLVVSSNELGTINATLQTLITARSVTPSLAVVGVILNQVRALADDVSVKTNAKDLARYCDSPLLGTVEYGAKQLSRKLDWASLANVT